MLTGDGSIPWIIFILIFFIPRNALTKVHKLERQLGSAVVLPPCPSGAASSGNNGTTMLFKADSGELLTLNGLLISENPRLLMRKQQSTELVIRNVDFADQGEYECRTDQTIIYTARLIVIHSSVVRLSALEGSNVTLRCMKGGMWIIEESHRGGPVRTQYTTELLLANIQRDDARFHTIICSTLDGHQKREYVIDVMYKPTVQLLMLPAARLMCTICAQPMPHRVRWPQHEGREGDENTHYTSINQSCIVHQFTLRHEEQSDPQLVIECEAENRYGIGRDAISFEGSMQDNATKIEAKRMNTIAASSVSNQSSMIRGTMPYLFAIHFLSIILFVLT